MRCINYQLSKENVLKLYLKLAFLVKNEVKCPLVWKQSQQSSKSFSWPVLVFNLSKVHCWSPGLPLALLPWLCLSEETHRVVFLLNLCKAAQTTVEPLSLPHLLAPADLHEVWRPWWKIIACLIGPELLEARLPRKQIRCVVIAYSEVFGIAEAGLPKAWDFCS